MPVFIAIVSDVEYIPQQQNNYVSPTLPLGFSYLVHVCCSHCRRFSLAMPQQSPKQSLTLSLDPTRFNMATPRRRGGVAGGVACVVCWFSSWQLLISTCWLCSYMIWLPTVNKFKKKTLYRCPKLSL